MSVIGYVSHRILLSGGRSFSAGFTVIAPLAVVSLAHRQCTATSMMRYEASEREHIC